MNIKLVHGAARSRVAAVPNAVQGCVETRYTRSPDSGSSCCNMAPAGSQSPPLRGFAHLTNGFSMEHHSQGSVCGLAARFRVHRHEDQDQHNEHRQLACTGSTRLFRVCLVVVSVRFASCRSLCLGLGLGLECFRLAKPSAAQKRLLFMVHLPSWFTSRYRPWHVPRRMAPPPQPASGGQRAAQCPRAAGPRAGTAA